MNSLEISHSETLRFIRIFVNQKLVKECYETSELQVLFDNEFPAKIEVEFQPFKVKPVVRYNNFMLNYWLANIQLYDHKLEFEICENFYQAYKNKDIQGRLSHIGADSTKNADNILDKYLGIDNLYPDLVKEIKEIISE